MNTDRKSPPKKKTKKTQPIQDYNGSENSNEYDTNVVAQKNTKPPKQPSNNEFFEYLAYHGVKNQKAAELEKLKAAEELAGCTFKPQILGSSSITPSK